MDVIIGFGANLGDAVGACRQAVDRIRSHPLIRNVRVSKFYRSDPVGVTDQPPFVNGVLAAETDLAPEALLDVLLGLEQSFGRERTLRWGPRTLDLDLLACGDLVLVSERLEVPHPRMHERRFVLVPLLDVEPDWVHPVLKRPAGELLAELPEAGQGVEPIPGLEL